MSFPVQNNLKDLDPSFKTDLDLWDYFERGKRILIFGIILEEKNRSRSLVLQSNFDSSNVSFSNPSESSKMAVGPEFSAIYFMHF